MSVKSVFSAFTGFLAHHRADLTAVSGTLGALLDALPVNAETREHIKGMIAQVEQSAENISNALDNINFADHEPVVIKESDIENAVRSVISSGALDTAMYGYVTSYMAAHAAPPPIAAPAPAPVPVPATEQGGTGDGS